MDVTRMEYRAIDLSASMEALTDTEAETLGPVIRVDWGGDLWIAGDDADPIFWPGHGGDPVSPLEILEDLGLPDFETVESAVREEVLEALSDATEGRSGGPEWEIEIDFHGSVGDQWDEIFTPGELELPATVSVKVVRLADYEVLVQASTEIPYCAGDPLGTLGRNVYHWAESIGFRANETDPRWTQPQ